MTELEYFRHLEARVSRELGGMGRADLRRLWCDGFAPERFVATGGGSHVAGRVWIDGDQGDGSPWNFVVLLGPERYDRGDVPWAQLLPAEDATGRLFLDFERRFLKVKLSAARPDGS